MVMIHHQYITTPLLPGPHLGLLFHLRVGIVSIVVLFAEFPHYSIEYQMGMD